jgi:hypothetical protein
MSFQAKRRLGVLMVLTGGVLMLVFAVIAWGFGVLLAIALMVAGGVLLTDHPERPANRRRARG